MSDHPLFFEREKTFSAKVYGISDNLFSVSFPSPVKTGDPVNDTVHGLFYRVNGKKALVFVHGLHTSKEFLWMELGRRLGPKGISTFFVHLPYHMRRGEHRYTSRERINFMDGVFSYHFFRQASLDIVRAVDFLEYSGFTEFSIAGVSLGGIVTSISAGMDKRFKHIILIATGGDHEIITWESIALAGMRRSYHREGITREVCHRCRQKLEGFVKGVEKCKNPYIVKNRIICFYFDPLSFAPLLRERNVMMIAGRFDRTIPREATLKLWEAVNRPPLYYLNTGHLGISWKKGEIASLISRFLNS